MVTNKNFITIIIIIFLYQTFLIKILSFTHKQRAVSYKALQQLVDKNFLVQYLLHTNIGILTNQDALKKRIGGILIFYF